MFVFILFFVDCELVQAVHFKKLRVCQASQI